MFVYLDNNATTRCAPEVVDAMLPFFSERYANPASPHALARDASRAVARAREQVAGSLDCDTSEVYFTSGATEANNLAILGLADQASPRRKIVTSAIEHKSVLGPCAFLERFGYTVVTLPVSSQGVIDLETAANEIDADTLLVSLQLVNNEIGTVQPVQRISEMAHERGAFVHCDAVQALGKMPVSVASLDVDLCSFSSHKAYGPKGVGLLTVRRRTGLLPLTPRTFGGEQEGGVRPGTLNVPGIVGTGEACNQCVGDLRSETARIAGLRAALEEGIRRAAPEAVIVGAKAERVPGTTAVIFPGIAADILIARTPSVCMSSGSACSSGTLAPSHVMLAIGVEPEMARSAVRLSLGRYNDGAQIQAAIHALGESVRMLRRDCDRS